MEIQCLVYTIILPLVRSKRSGTFKVLFDILACSSMGVLDSGTQLYVCATTKRIVQLYFVFETTNLFWVVFKNTVLLWLVRDGLHGSKFALSKALFEGWHFLPESIDPFFFRGIVLHGHVYLLEIVNMKLVSHDLHKHANGNEEDKGVVKVVHCACTP